jgi:glyoxylase-like metal-dependent hydrolase (beta-lactamase superfamily II)
MRVIRYNVGPLDNNTYVVVDEDTKAAVIIDPSFESKPIWDEISQSGWRLIAVLNTHAHIDHVVENVYFMEQSGASIAMHPDDLPLLRAMSEQAAWMGMESPRTCEPDRLLIDNDRIEIGSSSLAVVCTPGHSPGSVSFIGDGFAIVGDALFAGSVGRTDLPGGNTEQLLRAIRDQLLVLADETVVYPGHGETTTIGEERRTNPFLI